MKAFIKIQNDLINLSNILTVRFSEPRQIIGCLYRKGTIYVDLVNGDEKEYAYSTLEEFNSQKEELEKL